MKASTLIVLFDVAAERVAQDQKWGEQNHLDGTGWHSDILNAEKAKREWRELADTGNPSWRAVMAEEVFESFAESDPEKLRAELIQVAAVAIAWVEAIDRRKP